MDTRKAKSRDPLKFPAANYNAFVEAAVWVKEQQRRLSGNGGNLETGALIVNVKNDSGATLSRFSAVGISDVVTAPTADADEFKNRTALKVKKPIAADAGRWLVLEQALKDQECGTAIVSGVTPCQINVNNAADLFVDITAANTTPQSGPSGFQILWVVGGVGTASTGLQWAVLRMGAPSAANAFVYCALTKTSGSNGDKTHPATYIYTAKTLDGVTTLGTGLQPLLMMDGTPTRPNGTRTVGTIGLGVTPNGASFVLLLANEITGTGTC